MEYIQFELMFYAFWFNGRDCFDLVPQKSCCRGSVTNPRSVKGSASTFGGGPAAVNGHADMLRSNEPRESPKSSSSDEVMKQ